jgi:hypothetical protein
MYARHQVPSNAREVGVMTGRDADGAEVKVAGYARERASGAVFWMIGWRVRDGRMVPGSRLSEQFSGASGAERFAEAMAASRAMLAASLTR